MTKMQARRLLPLGIDTAKQLALAREVLETLSPTKLERLKKKLIEVGRLTSEPDENVRGSGRRTSKITQKIMDMQMMLINERKGIIALQEGEAVEFRTKLKKTNSVKKQKDRTQTEEPLEYGARRGSDELSPVTFSPYESPKGVKPIEIQKAKIDQVGGTFTDDEVDVQPDVPYMDDVPKTVGTMFSPPDRNIEAHEPLATPHSPSRSPPNMSSNTSPIAKIPMAGSLNESKKQHHKQKLNASHTNTIKTASELSSNRNVKTNIQTNTSFQLASPSSTDDQPEAKKIQKPKKQQIKRKLKGEPQDKPKPTTKTKKRKIHQLQEDDCLRSVRQSTIEILESLPKRPRNALNKLILESKNFSQLSGIVSAEKTTRSGLRYSRA